MSSRTARLMPIAAAAVVILSVAAGPVAAGYTNVPGRATAPIQAQEDEPATALRVALGRLLGEHAYLLMETMRAVAFGGAEESALRGALDANSGELAAAITDVYGPAGGTGFAELWERHVDLLVDYAHARASGDATAEQRALTELGGFRSAFTEFLSSANPHLEGHAEAEAIQLHIDQLVAFTTEDYALAYEAARDAFTHMFRLGDHLARAIGDQFPDRFTGADIAFSPAADLRLTLDRLLGEHLVLSAEAMRAGLAAAPDADAARVALDANTRDLERAVGRYYGAEGGTAFGQLWREHVEAYLAFIDAVASGDGDARAASLGVLRDYHAHLGEFFATANPHLDSSAVAGLIRRHVQALITQVEATEAGDHVRAVATVREAYRHMFDVGDALAAAIVRHFPDRFEPLRRVPATSTGPAARADGGVLPVLALGATLAVVAVMAAGTVNSRREGGVGRRVGRARRR